MENNIEQTEKIQRYKLLRGLVAFLLVFVAVAIVGVVSLHEDEIVIAGEAEATEYRLSSKVPGRIEFFFYEEGDKVQKGDTLALLDSPEVNAKLRQAQAARSAANAQYQKALGGARNEQIAGAYEMWQKALAGEQIMQKSYERVKNLYEKEVVSLQKLDETKAQYDAAVATANAAKAQYDMAVNGAQKEDKQAAQALVNKADATIQEINSYLSELYVIAPANGEISDRYPKIGELVGTGSPIMSIVDLNDMWFTFSIRETMLQDMTVGKEVRLRVPALSDSIFQAKITHIKVIGNYATWRTTKENGTFDVKTFDVKIRPLQHIPNLRPGMTAIIEKEE